MILRKNGDLSIVNWCRVTMIKTDIGRHTLPNARSANAIFITRYKLFLTRIFLINAKIAIVSKFPKVMKAASQVRAQLQAMTCAWERASSVCKGDTTSETVVADVFFISFFVFTLCQRIVWTTQSEGKRYALRVKCSHHKNFVYFSSKLKSIIFDCQYSKWLTFST